MHHASSTVSLNKMMWATLLVCCLQASLAVVADDSTNTKSEDDNLQADLYKRDWNRNLNVWGKRGWSNLHGGWGIKRSKASTDDEMNYSNPIIEKRAWQSLQTGWGKRIPPNYDDISFQDFGTMPDDDHSIPLDPEYDFSIHDDEKRNWNKFSDGWGKRNKWEKFRGSWGKRDPAWSNLKGIWGKRNVPDQFTN